MKKILFLFLIFVNFGSSAQTSDLKDSLLNKLTLLKEQTHVKALIGGVWEGEKNILSVAFGESMTSVPADTSMHVRIGGITEIFFGTLIMILVDKGIIRLDDKVSKWIPDMLAADSVTVRMLITSTSGYKDYVLNKLFVDLITKEPFRNITREEIISYAMSDGKLNFPPGTQQKYSHTEFTILGEMLERATGKTLGELYEENIFRPLGLSHTGYNFNADIPYPVLHAYSSDRGIYEDATFWSPSWTRESGTLYSNLNDLAKWARAFGKGKLLSANSFKVLTSRPEGLENTKGLGSPDIYFASGFVVDNGWYVQNPSFNGYSGAFGYYPPKEITIYIFTTESEDRSSGAQAIEILKEIVKILTPEAVLKF